MFVSPLTLGIKNQEVTVSQKKGKSIKEIIRIQRDGADLYDDQGYPLLGWKSVLETLQTQLGRKHAFILELPKEHIQTQWLERPLGVMKSEYALFVPSLVSQWFDLPVKEVCFDYRLYSKQLTVVGAPKTLIDAWQRQFSTQMGRLVAIGPLVLSTFSTESPHLHQFNLLPWRQKKASWFFRCHLVCFSLGLLIFACGVYYSVHTSRQKIMQLKEKTQSLKHVYTEQRKQLSVLKSKYQCWKAQYLYAVRSEKQRQHNQRVKTIFYGLTERMPFTLDNITYHDKGMTLRGSAQHYDGIQKAVSQLLHVPFVQTATVTQFVRTSSHYLFEANLTLIQD